MSIKALLSGMILVGLWALPLVAAGPLSGSISGEIAFSVQTDALTFAGLDTTFEIDYAFGLRIAGYKGLNTVGHGGSWVGYRSGIIRFPEQKFSVVCLANLSSINPSNLCRQIADIYLADQLKEEPKEVEVKKEVTSIQLSKAELEEKTGIFYDKESGRWVTLSVEEEKLKADMNGRAFLLSPVSKTSFKALGARFDASLEFLPEEKGKW